MAYKEGTLRQYLVGDRSIGDDLVGVQTRCVFCTKNEVGFCEDLAWEVGGK